jgi:hypothetical protein
VALTGRAALGALIGTLVILAARDVVALIAVNGVLLAMVTADLALAAPVRPLRLTRAGDTKVLLGQSAPVTPTAARARCAPTSGTPGSPAPGRSRIMYVCASRLAARSR